MTFEQEIKAANDRIKRKEKRKYSHVVKTSLENSRKLERQWLYRKFKKLE